jgi:hypothetical protein
MYYITYIMYKLFIVLVMVYLLYYCDELYDNQFDLVKDGICILYDPIYTTTTDYPCPSLQSDVLNRLPPGYMFMDYVYKINDTSLSTFHRDVTSSKRLFHTKHPVYTVILYNYSGELLSVCPGSHNSYPFVWSRIVNVSGSAGTVFLFDSEVLHAGRTNQCHDRKIIQYKLCHKDDLDKVSHLQNIHVEKTEVCRDDLSVKLKRKLSYFFELPINTITYPLMIKREDTNTWIGKIQSWIPLQFYNNY